MIQRPTVTIPLGRTAGRHRLVASAIIVVMALLGAACTSSAGSDAGTTITAPEDNTSPVTIDSLDTFVDTCRAEMLQGEPNIERLALDPTLTNLALGLLTDEVPSAAAELRACLGDENTANYLEFALIITGQRLPDGTAECLIPFLADNGDALLEVDIRRTRLEASSPQIAEPFIEAMLACVPGRFLGAPIKTANPAGYALAVDEECFDQAQIEDDTAMRLFWEGQTASQSSVIDNDWTDDEVQAVVAPMYECIDTGDLIAADPEIGAELSAATRRCIGEVALRFDYWESRVAQQPFDTAAYQAETDACLTPEERAVVLGTPLPVDDPETSNFSVVDGCYSPSAGVTADDEAEVTEGEEGAEDELLSDLADLDDDAAAALVADLSQCAAAEGIAGRYAATRFNNRALPLGSYECFLETAPADLASWLRGILYLDAGRDVSEADGETYIDSITECVAPNIFTRPALGEYSSVSSGIEADCIDGAFAADPDALRAYWSGIVFDEFDDDGIPTAAASAAVAPIYGCVNAGVGFAAVVADTGTTLAAATKDCIDSSLMALLPIETAIIGGSLADGAFNGAIADCLTDEEVEAIAGN